MILRGRSPRRSAMALGIVIAGAGLALSACGAGGGRTPPRSAAEPVAMPVATPKTGLAEGTTKLLLPNGDLADPAGRFGWHARCRYDRVNYKNNCAVAVGVALAAPPFLTATLETPDFGRSYTINSAPLALAAELRVDGNRPFVLSCGYEPCDITGPEAARLTAELSSGGSARLRVRTAQGSLDQSFANAGFAAALAEASRQAAR